MTEPPFYYRYFVGDGRELLAETLGDPHPFTLSGDKIVEGVLAAGSTPNLERVEREPYTGADAVSIVEREGSTFSCSSRLKPKRSPSRCLLRQRVRCSVCGARPMDVGPDWRELRDPRPWRSGFHPRTNSF